jgi:hypothetical protein
MKISEITNDLHAFAATVRIKRGKSTTTAKTLIFADGISQARALLISMHGEDSVVSVNRISDRHLDESTQVSAAPKQFPRILPTDYKHDVAQRVLLAQIKRNALRIKPTLNDLKAAQSDFEAEQYRVNQEYENKRKWADIRKRRMKKSS